MWCAILGLNQSMLAPCWTHPGRLATCQQRPGPASTCPPTTTSTPLDCGPAWRNQVMNSPSAATPSCQSRLVRTLQRRNNAMAPAYDLVVNSEPSRRKNASASATTARSSLSTVQYLTPDGNLTGNARTPISSRSRHLYHYQPRAPQPGRSVAEPVRVAGLRNVTQQVRA